MMSCFESVIREITDFDRKEITSTCKLFMGDQRLEYDVVFDQKIIHITYGLYNYEIHNSCNYEREFKFLFIN